MGLPMSLVPGKGLPSAGLNDGPWARAQQARRGRLGGREPTSSPPCMVLLTGSQSPFWKALSGVKEKGPCVSEAALCSQPRTRCYSELRGRPAVPQRGSPEQPRGASRLASADGAMGTRAAAHLCEGIVPALKQEGNSDTCPNEDEL